MWAAFARQFAAYAITRRGKKLFALIGVLALCFCAALLVDMQLYLSAGFIAAVLACFSGAAYIVQHAKVKRAELERLARRAEAARRRALVAQARLDRMDHAKAAVRDAVAGAAQSARAAVVDVTKEAASVAAETVEAVRAAPTRWRTPSTTSRCARRRDDGGRDGRGTHDGRRRDDARAGLVRVVKAGARCAAIRA